MIEKIVVAIFLIGGVVLIMSILFALPTMLLWNYVMPDLFGLKEIDFWESMCLLLLCGFLFKSSSSSKD
jgi:hypothetical protein